MRWEFLFENSKTFSILKNIRDDHKIIMMKLILFYPLKDDVEMGIWNLELVPDGPWTGHSKVFFDRLWRRRLDQNLDVIKKYMYFKIDFLPI